MYNEKERKLLSISRAVIDLHGFFIVTTENKIIDNPVIMIDLLSKVELETFGALLQLSPDQKIRVEETIVHTGVLNIIGYDRHVIDLDMTPAGVITTIASAITLKTEQYIKNDSNLMYLETDSTVNYIEQMCAIISYYMNLKYDYVISLPINEIYKRYTICQQSFSSQISPLTKEDIENG